MAAGGMDLGEVVFTSVCVAIATAIAVTALSKIFPPTVEFVQVTPMETYYVQNY